MVMVMAGTVKSLGWLRLYDNEEEKSRKGNNKSEVEVH